MWQQQYEALNVGDREEFTRLVNLLLARNFILRDRYGTKERSMKINHDYRFVERHIDLFREYLRVSGWELQKDNNYGVIALYNRYETNRHRLNKNITIMLYILRLVYEEEREKLSLKREIVTKVSHMVEKMVNLGLVEKKPSNKDLYEAFGFLRRFNIIDKVEGDFADPDTGIIIYPSILFIVTNDKISEIYEIALSGEEDAEEEQEETDDMEEEQ